MRLRGMLVVGVVCYALGQFPSSFTPACPTRPLCRREGAWSWSPLGCPALPCPLPLQARVALGIAGIASPLQKAAAPFGGLVGLPPPGPRPRPPPPPRRCRRLPSGHLHCGTRPAADWRPDVDLCLCGSKACRLPCRAFGPFSRPVLSLIWLFLCKRQLSHESGARRAAAEGLAGWLARRGPVRLNHCAGLGAAGPRVDVCNGAHYRGVFCAAAAECGAWLILIGPGIWIPLLPQEKNKYNKKFDFVSSRRCGLALCASAAASAR